MENKNKKPKQTAQQLVESMKEKGICFRYTSETEAENYLSNVNNYFRTAAYRKNYQRHQNGNKKGKYIGLDFAYLQELSTIDMHFRFIVSKMCLDIEHDLKVKTLKDIEDNQIVDVYGIVEKFLSENTYIIRKIEANSASPFTSALIHKYFTIQSKHSKGERNEIVEYNDCPVWVLLELLTFGDFIKFYKFYYSSRNYFPIPIPIINLVKSLRNGVAHNNCILADLARGTSSAPKEISREIAKIKTINSNQRQKKLSCRPMLEFTCLLYVYKIVVSNKVKYHRVNELKKVFFERMVKKKGFFVNNELIRSNYEFACKVILAFF